MKAVRGGTPKNATGSRDVTPPNRTKIVQGNSGPSAQESPSSSRSSTPVSQSSTGTRLSDSNAPESYGRRSREAARRSQRLIKQVIAGDRRPQSSSGKPQYHKAKIGGATPTSTPRSSKKKLPNSKKKKYEFEESSSEEEAVVDYESPESESESTSGGESDTVVNKLDLSDVESDLSDVESEISSASSAQRKLNQGKTSRPPTPVWCKEDVKLPELTLPKSSNDLLIEQQDIMPALAVYEVLRHFFSQLRLSPFRFEDFCAALCSDEQCALLSESQLCLLKAMIKEEEANGTTYGAHDQRDSINVQHFLMDGMTWMAIVHQYIESDNEYKYALPSAEDENFPFVSVSKKLNVLQFLCDQFLSSNKVREEIISEGAITYDDHCRSCHKLGDLICCETCSAVYHLECVEPPLKAVPEDDWLCTICKAHRVPGVYDCISDVEKSGMLIRQEPIGVDRHGRKYWFLCRRIFIESEDYVWYYSTKLQLEELMQCLDPLVWEKDLCQQLSEALPEILHGMQKTLELTNKHKGSLKSAVEVANDEILEAKKAKEEEERRKKEEEERRLEEERHLGEEKKLAEERRAAEEAEAERMETEKSQENSDVLTGTGEVGGKSELPEGGTKLEEGKEKPEGESPAKEGAMDQKQEQEGAAKTESSPGETEAKRGIMTRSRNPNYKPPPPKSTPYVTYSTTMPKQTTTIAGLGGRVLRSTLKKDEPAVVVNAKGEKSVVIVPARFKLGMEGTYKLYNNLFSTKRLALNKPQHAEDRDKKRHMANKFGIQSDVTFKWQGTIYGNKLLTISTLRLTITQLESNIPQPFMHTNWPTHRNNWIKAVHMCSKPQAFSLALSVLECAIKPVVFYPVWNDAIGHTRLKRVSIMDKEERKKAEKRKSDLEDELHKIAPWVKYCFPIKHQIWKHKGEEFRTFFGGGWTWKSSTRKIKPLPPPSPAKIFLDESIRQAEADETNQFRTAMNGFLGTEEDDEELPLSQLKKESPKSQETSPGDVKDEDHGNEDHLELSRDDEGEIQGNEISETAGPERGSEDIENTEKDGVEQMDVQPSEISETELGKPVENPVENAEKLEKSEGVDVAEEEMARTESPKDDQVQPMEGVEIENHGKDEVKPSAGTTSENQDCIPEKPGAPTPTLQGASSVPPGEKATCQGSTGDKTKVPEVSNSQENPAEPKEGQINIKQEEMVTLGGGEAKPVLDSGAPTENQVPKDGKMEVKKEGEGGKLEKGTESDSTDSNMEDVVPDSPYQKSYIQLMAKLNKVAGETVNKTKNLPYREMTTPTVDVSASLQTYPRTFYKVIPYRSRLEGLLEKRMKMEVEKEEKFKVEQQRYLQYQELQKKRQELHEELKKVEAAKERELKKAQGESEKATVEGESKPPLAAETVGQKVVDGPISDASKPTLPAGSGDLSGEKFKGGNADLVEGETTVVPTVGTASKSATPTETGKVPGMPIGEPSEGCSNLPANGNLAETGSGKVRDCGTDSSSLGTNLSGSSEVQPVLDATEGAPAGGTRIGGQDVKRDDEPDKPAVGSFPSIKAASGPCAAPQEASKVQLGDGPAVNSLKKDPSSSLNIPRVSEIDEGDRDHMSEPNKLGLIGHGINNHDEANALLAPKAEQPKIDNNLQGSALSGSSLPSLENQKLAKHEEVGTVASSVVVNSKEEMASGQSPNSGTLGNSCNPSTGMVDGVVTKTVSKPVAESRESVDKNAQVDGSPDKPEAFPQNSESHSSMGANIPNHVGDDSNSLGANSIQDVQPKSLGDAFEDAGVASNDMIVGSVPGKPLSPDNDGEVGMETSLGDSEDILSKSLELSGVSPEKEGEGAVAGEGQGSQANCNTHNSNVSGLYEGVLELDRRKDKVKGQLFSSSSSRAQGELAPCITKSAEDRSTTALGEAASTHAGNSLESGKPNKLEDVSQKSKVPGPVAESRNLSQAVIIPSPSINKQGLCQEVASTAANKVVSLNVSKALSNSNSASVTENRNNLAPPTGSCSQPEVKDKVIPKILETPMGNCPILKMSHDDIANALQRKIESLDKQLSEKVTKPAERRLRGRVRLSSGIGRRKVQKKVAKPLPICYMFTTRSRRKSIMVQPPQDLRRLCRRGGFMEVKEGFNYNTKNVGHFWPLPAPRPYFRFCWRYRLQTARSLSGIALLLRVLWSCMRWDDITLKPSTYTQRTYSTGTEDITETVTDKRDIPPTGLVSEFLFRKTIKPIEVDEDDLREIHKPQRSGLRSSSAPVKVMEEVKKPQGPRVVEEWVSEDKLQLWEIHQYCEKLKKDALVKANAEKKAQLQQKKAAEKAEKAAEKEKAVRAATVAPSSGQAITPASSPLITVAGGKRLIKREKKQQQGMKTMSIEVLKSQLEEQLRKQKESMQLKRNQVTTPMSTGVIPKLNLQAQARKKLKSAPVMMYNPKAAASGSHSLILGQSASGQTKVVYTPGSSAGQLGQAANSAFIPGMRKVVIGGQRLPTPAGQQQTPFTPKTTTLTGGQKLTIGGNMATPTGAGTGLSGTQLTGQAQVFTAQAQVVHVGGQKFVITPAQVQVQGSGQVIQAQLVQTTTPQGATIQRLVLTPNAQGQKTIPNLGGGAAASTSGLPTVTLPGVTQPQTVSLQSPALQTTSTPLQSTPLQSTPQPLRSPLAVIQQQQQQQQLRLQQQQQLLGSGALGTGTLGSPVRTQVVSQLIPRVGTTITPPAARLSTGVSLLAGAIPSALLSSQSTATVTVPQTTSLSTSDQVIQLQKRIQMQLQQLSSGGSSGEEPRNAQIPSIKVASSDTQLEQIARLQSNDKQLQEEFRQQMKAKPEGTSRKRSDSRSSKEKKEQSRMREVTSLMKHMLEKIERDERKALKRKRKEQHREEKRLKVNHQKRMLILSKQRDNLRNEILIRRTLLEKRLTWDVREERALALKTAAEKARKRKPARKRGPAPKKRQKVAAQTTPKKTPPKSSREKQSAARVVKEPAPVVKQEVVEEPVPVATNNVQEAAATELLYCICQTKYDASKFYVGCDMCLNWFHGSCVGVSEDMAKNMKDYICRDCDAKKQEREDEIYCLCRQPYDETKFYIGCDKCNDWFHGSCVGITQQEAEVVEEYICPRCNSSNIQNVVASKKTLTTKDSDQLRRVVRQLESHKMGWPFLEPVSELDAPDYYDIIKDPIDLSKISEKLISKKYVRVNEFVADVSKMFDNCRLYNASDSMFFQCADMLEKFFVQKMKNFKQ